MALTITGYEHLHVHTDFSLLDGYGMVEEYALRAPQINQKFLTVSDHGMLGVVPRQIKACETICKKHGKDALSPIFACFFQGQPVETAEGRKPIESILPGDYVLTHEGRYRKVLRTFSRSYTGRKYGIKLAGSKSVSVWMTDEHPVLVANVELTRSWVKACDIRAGRRRAGKGIRNYRSYVCYPKSNEMEVASLSLRDMLPEYDWSNGHAFKRYETRQPAEWKSVKAEQAITYDFCRFVGLYTAEGSMAFRWDGEPSGSFRFSFNLNEGDLQQFCLDAARSMWGIEGSLYQYPDTSKAEVHFCCKPVADMLLRLCGSGAENKHLPYECFQWPLPARLALLDGLLQGDGKNPNRESNKSQQTTLKASSRTLADQTRRLLMDFGQWSTVAAVENSFQVPISPFAKYRRSLSDGKYVYKPIAEIIEEDVSGETVYNIEVEEDNSYVVDFAVHNCELYVNRLQPECNSPDDMQKFMKDLDEDQLKEIRQYGAHLLAIAYNETGYKNLVRLSSWGWTKGFYRRPRVNYEQLLKHKEGLIFTSCCYASEVGKAFDRGLAQGPKAAEEAGFAMIERYIEMFGREHYFLEMMLLDFKKQKPYDAFIVKASEKYGLRLIVTNDCLVDGTLVWTDRGFRLIEDVVPGDRVLTHMGRYREVEIAVARKVRPDEQVYEVRATVGSYSFRATGNHKIYLHRDGEYAWVPTAEVKKGDRLVYPDYSRCGIYSNVGVRSLDLKQYFSPDDFYEQEYSEGRNFGSGLRLDGSYFVSRQGFAGEAEVRIPTELHVGNDLLKVLGWYVAEGWSDTNSYQVGFALHADEQSVADFLIGYFSQFGIAAKTYKVSENGIAVRFSSKVFNRVFSRMCGKGANSKHLPYCGETWVGKWSQEQMRTMLACVRLGDGSDSGAVVAFHSTSRILVYEVATAMNGFGFIAIPSVDQNRNPNWKPCWHLNYSGEAGSAVRRYLAGQDAVPQTSGFWKYDNGNWLVKVQEVVPVEYEGNVHDFQVNEDHSFTANMAVVSNCHYCKQEDSHFQRLMLMVQTNRTIQEIQKAMQEDAMQDFFELQDANLWMKSEEELNAKWETDYRDVIPCEVFCEAKRNTVRICEKAKGVKLDRSLKLPVLPDADDKLKDEIMKGFQRRGLPKNREYLERIKEEFSLITRKGFSSYFLLQQMMTDEARRISPLLLGWGDGTEAVGPGRGSAVGALTCYCLGVTDVDPVFEGLLFSRFMSEARGGRSITLEFRNIDPLPPEEAFA